MARESKARDAHLSSARVHPEKPGTPAPATRQRDLSAETRYRIASGRNKLATNEYTFADIFPSNASPRGEIVTAQSVEKHAHDTFGTLEKAEHWLNRPNPLFDGKTPRQVLQADPYWVEAELVRIDYGVYA